MNPMSVKGISQTREGLRSSRFQPSFLARPLATALVALCMFTALTPAHAAEATQEQPAAVPAVQASSSASAVAEAASQVAQGDAVKADPSIFSVHNRKQELEFHLSPAEVGEGGIWVVSDSRRMSGLLMRDLASRGYKVASSFDSATTKLSIKPLMTLEKKGRQVNLNVAQLIEKSAKPGEQDLVNGDFKSGIKAGVASNTAGFAGGSALKAGGAFFLLDTVLDVSGVTAKFNEMTVGDARGYCIAKIWGGCHEWDLITHYTRFILAVKLPNNEVKKGLIQSDSLIADVNPSLAFLMAWSDLNKAMTGQKIGKCFENNRQECVPQ
jgi:hypothetical protein